jgi:hypothetical protein
LVSDKSVSKKSRKVSQRTLSNQCESSTKLYPQMKLAKSVHQLLNSLHSDHHTLNGPFGA